MSDVSRQCQDAPDRGFALPCLPPGRGPSLSSVVRSQPPIGRRSLTASLDREVVQNMLARGEEPSVLQRVASAGGCALGLLHAFASPIAAVLATLVHML